MDELTIANIRRFHRKDRDLLESSDDSNQDMVDILGKRRKREHRKHEVSGSGTKTTSSNTGDMTGTEILNRRSRKDRASDRIKTNSSGGSSGTLSK
jgi:hypothetical protein